jgi:hypothetical protein
MSAGFTDLIIEQAQGSGVSEHWGPSVIIAVRRVAHCGSHMLHTWPIRGKNIAYIVRLDIVSKQFAHV